MNIGGTNLSISDDIDLSTPLIKTQINGNLRIFQVI